MRHGKRGLLVASYGASRPEARTRCVEPLVKELEQAFCSDCTEDEPVVREAYTSAKVRAKLAGCGERILAVDEALEELWSAGVRDVCVAVSHLVDGAAYGALRQAVETHASLFDAIRLARPLLSSAEDCKRVAEILDGEVPRRADSAVVLVGHGGPHAAQLAYLALGYALRERGRNDMYVGMLDDKGSCDAVAHAVECAGSGVRRVLLAPLLISSSAHAQRDIFSTSGWRGILERAGYAVEVLDRGLGELAEIRRLAVDHMRRAPEVEVGAQRLSSPGDSAAVPSRFPLFIDLQGRRCLVVGAGTVGMRRVRALRRFGATVVVVDPNAAMSMSADADEVRHRPYAPGDEQGFGLVIAATDDRAVNHMIGERCRRLGIPVSVADAPDECTFFFPALCEGDNLVAGVVSRSADHSDHALVARAAADMRVALARAEADAACREGR